MIVRHQKLLRKYVSQDIDFSDVKSASKPFKKILKPKVSNASGLETMIMHYSELLAIWSEHEAKLFIETTRFTADEDIQQRYSFYINSIAPELKKLSNRIYKKISALSKDYALDEEYRIYLKRITNSVELFRDENVRLEKRLANLVNRYDRITGGITVKYEGRELTQAQMSAYFESADRQIRRSAYEALMYARLDKYKELVRIYKKQFELRNKVAENAGFEDFRAYVFRRMERFDYTPEDCLKFHRDIKEHILPVDLKLKEFRKKRLGLDELKPYDKAVDIFSSEPLKPFKTPGELIEKTVMMFSRINPVFSDVIKLMKNNKMFDLACRKNKAPGGYCYYLPETRLPFIFMHANGTHSEMTTLFHEAGHAFHAHFCQEQKLTEYKEASSEISEVASMSMELITMDNWDVFYPDRKDLIRAKLSKLEEIFDLLPWISIIDLIQHWLYTKKDFNISSFENIWLNLMDEYMPATSFKGYEDFKRTRWAAQLHLFHVPFYYIEYAMAQLGALQMWLNYRRDPKKTISSYISGFAFGGSKPLPELFKAVGIQFNFSKEMLVDMSKELINEIQSLTAQLDD